MNRTRLCTLLGMRVPIIQAPMAGGPSTPELVAAVSAAGGLGSFGFAYTQPEEMLRQCATVRTATDAPFAINLFVDPLPGRVAPDAQRQAIAALAAYHRELGLPPPEPVEPPYAPDLEAQLEAVEAIAPAVLTTHFGGLPAAWIARFSKRGIRLGASATCVADAREVETMGFDFVIAQGVEAGGHRGTWSNRGGGGDGDALTGIFALTRLVADAVTIPVVAAGGIMDGAGIVAALALGADAAQLGTAFIACPESGASPVHKRSLLAAEGEATAMTRQFSGRPARGLVNRFMREQQSTEPLPFPVQNKLTGALRVASAKADNGDFVAMWAGQAAALARAMPAAALIAELENEMRCASERLGALFEAPPTMH